MNSSSFLLWLSHTNDISWVEHVLSDNCPGQFLFLSAASKVKFFLVIVKGYSLQVCKKSHRIYIGLQFFESRKKGWNYCRNNLYHNTKRSFLNLMETFMTRILTEQFNICFWISDLKETRNPFKIRPLDLKKKCYLNAKKRSAKYHWPHHGYQYLPIF